MIHPSYVQQDVFLLALVTAVIQTLENGQICAMRSIS